MNRALETLLEALGEESAPTSVHERERALRVHIADARAGLEVAEVRAAGVIADLGSGAGLPGLVLAASLPQARVVCVESARRKAEWIAATAARCGLVDVEVVWSRAEEWSAGLGACDVVTARALAALPVLCEYAAPLLRPGGALVCWKGGVAPEEEAAGRAAAAVLGLSEPAVLSVCPYAGSERRTLWVFRRVGDVPDGFPRRPGMASKRPLGAAGSGPNPPGPPVASRPR